MKEKINIYYPRKDVRLLNQELLKNPPNVVNYILAQEITKMSAETLKSNKITLKKRVAKLILKSELSNKIGLFIPYVNLSNNNSIDLIHMYNRIMISSKPFIMELENGSAFLHYQPKKFNSILKPLINKLLLQKSLKKIVGISKASKFSLEKFLADYKFKNIEEIINKIDYVYPLVPENNNINREFIINKRKKDTINILFISTVFDLKGGKELVDAFIEIQKTQTKNINLTLITRKSDIPDKYMRKINEHNNIKLVEANLDRNDLYALYYSNADIFVLPTYRDSFGLVILEAIKSGLPVITTNTFATPELVKHNYNGFLTTNPISFFNEDFSWNEEYWGDKIYSFVKDYYNNELKHFLAKKMNLLINNDELRIKFSLNSYKISEETFDVERLKQKWEKIYKESAF